MKILGIETSTYSGSIALADGDALTGEYFFNAGPSHTEKLVPSIDMMLSDCGVEKHELEGIAVSLGPGSFTSLRVGISSAKTLAYALKIPVAGISSLEALAYNALLSERTIVPVIDARKGQLYCAAFSSTGSTLRRLRDDTLIDADSIGELITGNSVLVGEVSLLYKDLLEHNAGDCIIYSPHNLNYPRASSLCFLGMERLREGLADDVYALRPNYIRKSDAEIHRKERKSDER